MSMQASVEVDLLVVGSRAGKRVSGVSFACGSQRLRVKAFPSSPAIAPSSNDPSAIRRDLLLKLVLFIRKQID